MVLIKQHKKRDILINELSELSAKNRSKLLQNRWLVDRQHSYTRICDICTYMETPIRIFIVYYESPDRGSHVCIYLLIPFYVGLYKYILEKLCT